MKLLQLQMKTEENKLFNGFKSKKSVTEYIQNR